MNLKLDEIKQLVKDENYQGAAEIADEIDWGKCKKNMMITLAADVYETLGQYDRAKELLLIAYERTPLGRQIAYKLSLLCVKNNELEEAKEFYLDFIDMAPRDNGKYILQYEISKAAGVDNTKLIDILNTYLEEDMDDYWAFELAILYAQVGDYKSCVDVCDEIFLWFSEGKYVTEALELKQQITPLTKSQEEALRIAKMTRKERQEMQYQKEKERIKKEEEEKEKQTYLENQKKIEELMPEQETNEKKEFDDEPQVSVYDDSLISEMEMQEQLAKSMEDIMEEEENKQAEDKTDFDDTSRFLTSDIVFETASFSLDDYINPEIRQEKPTESEEKQREERTQTTRTVVSPETAEQVQEQSVDEKEVKVETPILESEALEAKTEETPVQETKVKEEAAQVVTPEETAEIKNEADSKEVQEELLEEKKEEVPQEEVSVADIVKKEKKRKGSLKKAFEIAKTIAPIKEAKEKEEAAKKAEEADKLANHLKNVLEDKAEEAAMLEETGFTRNDLPKQKEADALNEEDGNVFETVGEVPSKLKLKGREEETKEESEEEKTEQKQPEQAFDPRFHIEGSGQMKLDLPEDRSKIEKQKTGQIPIDEVLKDFEARGILKSDTVNKAMGVVKDTSEEQLAKQEEAPIQETESFKDESKIEIKKALEESNEESNNDPIVKEDKTQVRLEVDAEGNLEISQPEDLVAIDEKKEFEDPKVVVDKEMMENEDDVIELGILDLMNEEELKILEEKRKEKETDDIDEVLKLVDDLENKKDEEAQEVGIEDFDIPETPEEGRYYLQDEYKPVFEQFLSIPGMEHALAKTIYNLKEKFAHDGTSKTNNVMIVGEKKSGKTTLAIDIIKIANRERGRKGRKIAKVNGIIINKKGIMAAMPKLLGSDLIIENAGVINRSMWMQLVRAFEGYTDEMIVVLEDEKTTMDRLIETHPNIENMFNNIIVIKEYDINEWVAYAKAYAKEKGYAIDEMGTLALFAKIDQEYGRNHGLEKENIEQIINNAITKAEGRGLMRFLRKLFRRKKTAALRILKENHF